MTKHFSLRLLLVALSISVSGCAVFKPAPKKGMAQTSEKSEKKDKNGIKPYSSVITKEAKSDKGLFTV
ncbi:MAG: hypothetical protein WCD31_06845, partial [Gillisia sp.]